MKPALLSAAMALALAGCATPDELKRPLTAPTMARPAETNPLPAYVAPEPQSHP